MRFKMQSFATDGVLAGALLGQKVFAAMIGETSPPAEPEVMFIDFAGVDVATASFLRESVIAFRNHARSHWTTVYPVVTNLSAKVLEELENYVNERGDALVISNRSDVRVLGRLEEIQEFTLKAVLKEGEVDAPTLAARYKKNGPSSPTAWNNRLVALALKGLLIELATGRSKRYRPVLDRLRYGT